MELLVTADFGDYKRGDRITDAAAIDKARASNPGFVVNVNDALPNPAAPAPAIPKKPA